MQAATAVLTDSASYLPLSVRQRFGIVTIPMIVVVNGSEYREFVDFDSPKFYEMLSGGAKVSTSQPSPGSFLEQYERLRDQGAEQILSIHIGSTLSGTVNSARIAAEMASVPVTVVDSGQASFLEGLCVWEACEALAAGEDIPVAVEAVHRTASDVGNVFVVRGLTLLQRGGRIGPGMSDEPNSVPILALIDNSVRPVGAATSVTEAIDAMISWLADAIGRQPGKCFRVGVANGDADELAAILESKVRELDRVSEVVPYVIGPAIGAHTGPGCTGLAFVGRPI